MFLFLSFDRYASNESLNQDGSIYRPKTGRLGRQGSTESLNRVAFSSQDPPSWSTGRRQSRAETPSYIEVFRSNTPNPNPTEMVSERPTQNYPRRQSVSRDLPPFATDNENVVNVVRPKTTNVR